MRAQKALEPSTVLVEDGNKKKRKASDEDAAATIRKRTKATNPSLPAGFFDAGVEVEEEKVTPTKQMKIPSRPATPLKTPTEVPTRVTANVDENEWAAFEAEIAAAEAVPRPMIGNGDGVISAPAMTAAELKAKDAEEDNKRRRERLEAEAEGDKEDAARKLDEEFEEMESLEQRVSRLKEKREALRMKENTLPALQAPVQREKAIDDDEDDEDEDDDDDWDGFRMKA
jgi:zinc finger protein 830